jgi:hypothetical protein
MGFILSYLGIGPLQRAISGGCQLPPLPIRFALMSFVFTFASAFTQVIERSYVSPTLLICTVMTKLVFVFYTLAKVSTVAFLGIRAAVVYEFGPSQSFKCVSKRLVIALTGVFMFGFALTLGFTVIDKKIVVNEAFLTSTGVCFTGIPILTNLALNFVDALSSVLFLFFFVLPHMEVLQSTKREFDNTHSVVLTERAHKMEHLIRENLLVGGITTVLALLCSIGVTLLESEDIRNSIPILGGSLREVDILVNCLMQAYGIRGYFSVKSEWNMWYKKMISKDHRNENTSERLLSTQHN